jgi:hypothetical protein
VLGPRPPSPPEKTIPDGIVFVVSRAPRKGVDIRIPPSPPEKTIPDGIVFVVGRAPRKGVDIRILHPADTLIRSINPQPIDLFTVTTEHNEMEDLVDDFSLSGDYPKNRLTRERRGIGTSG